MSKILPAKVIISRSYGGNDDRVVHMTIEDETSGCRILELNMSLDQWATATFSSFGKATVELYDEAPIGKKQESKEELVPVPNNMWSGDKGWVDEALKPFEVDGWVARKDDLFNHHRRASGTKTPKQRVLFIRFVNAQEAVIHEGSCNEACGAHCAEPEDKP